MENNKVKLNFSAINPYIEKTLESNVERDTRGNDYVRWGESNTFPNQLYDLYKHTTTLHSAVDSIVNYICGNSIKASFSKPNRDYTWEDLIRNIAFDYVLTGSFAINILRNSLGMPIEYHYVPVINLRSDKENKVFWYNESWDKLYGNKAKITKYPKYSFDSVAASSIYYYKNNLLTTYSRPMWEGAINAVETERRIDEYNLNQTINGFSASYIINLNNGVPTDEQMEEIEENFTDKFCGSENRGRLVLAYNNDKEHEATIQAIPEDKKTESYLQVVDWVRTQILSAFRIHPVLCGLMAKNTGFNDQDFQQAFAVFSKTVIQQLQSKIVEKLNDLIPTLNLEIEPFSIDFGEVQDNKTITNEITNI